MEQYQRQQTEIMTESSDLDTQNVLISDVQVRLLQPQGFQQLTGQMTHSTQPNDTLYMAK